MSVASEILTKLLVHRRESVGGLPMAAATNYLLPFRILSRPISTNSNRAPITMSRCTSVGEPVFSVTSSSEFEFDYLGQSTKGDLNVNFEHLEALGNTLLFLFLYWVLFSYFIIMDLITSLLSNTGIDGHETTLNGPIEEVARMEAEEAADLLRDLGIPVLL